VAVKSGEGNCREKPSADIADMLKIISSARKGVTNIVTGMQ